MANKLLRISLLLPLMAMSSAAYAHHNDQHRPNELSQYGAFAQAGPPAAGHKAQVQRLRSVQPGSYPKACTYQGGPKSGLWTCR